LGYSRASLGRRALLLLVSLGAIAAALAHASPAAAFSRTDARVAMDDGVELGTTLYLPDGAPPASGWPAVMMLHGLGGERGDMNTHAESVFVPQGYAVLTFDARAHGESGGLLTLDGPREVADVRALFERLAARPDVDERRIGAWGLSYGGGAVLRAAVEGVPFAALEPFETWTDLYGALFPQNFAKSGAIFGFLQEVAPGRSPFVDSIKDDALASRNLAALKRIADERSTLPRLSSLTVPTMLFQGRRDFAFDMQQAIAGYTRLRGPKRLYLGNLGHAPSTFAADDFGYFMRRSREWFDRFLKGVPNGIDTGPNVELAPSPFVESRIGRYAGPPATRLHVSSRGFRRAVTLAANGKLAVTFSRTARAQETFGAATVRVVASTPARWPHLVAVLSAVSARGETVIAAGGIRTASLRSRPRRLTIRLLSTATAIPAGSRLRVTLAAASTAQHPSNLLYLQAAPPGSRLRIHSVHVTTPFLRTPVSR
jgi:predicted acyl esterase